jgi:hypothetical protein
MTVDRYMRIPRGIIHDDLDYSVSAEAPEGSDLHDSPGHGEELPAEMPPSSPMPEAPTPPNGGAQVTDE